MDRNIAVCKRIIGKLIMYKLSYNKYNNKKIVRNGISFDSTKEANFYSELLYRERIGEIKNIRLQVPYELIPNQYETEMVALKSGKVKEKQVLVERKVTYLADFVVFDNKLNCDIVYDCKSPITRTPVYIVKKKLMLYIHNIKIKEV